MIEIRVADAAWRSALPDMRALSRRAVEAALAVAPPLPAGPKAELSFLFANDEAMRALNRDFRGKDKSTNVLAFANLDVVDGATPVAPGDQVMLGDVVLALETVRNEAVKARKPLGHHVSHLIVHGVLHLLGFDHQKAREALAMEALERAALARLGIDDPYEAAQPLRTTRGRRPVMA